MFLLIYSMPKTFGLGTTIATLTSKCLIEDTLYSKRLPGAYSREQLVEYLIIFNQVLFVFKLLKNKNISSRKIFIFYMPSPIRRWAITALNNFPSVVVLSNCSVYIITFYPSIHTKSVK